MHYEDGFYFNALPSLSGAAKSLIVILHGHGSHPNKYASWALKTQQVNPDADLILVRAPVALKATENQKIARSLPGIDDLYTWYKLDRKAHRQAGLILKHAFRRLTVFNKLNRLIDNQLQKRNLQDKDLAFIGFSMGGTMAVQTALRRKGECAAVVCHSGAVLPFTKARKKPDTLMIMGDQDELFFLPEKKTPRKGSRFLNAFKKAGLNINLHHKRSVRRLQKAGIEVTERIFKDLDHRITDASWQEASSFVAQKLRPGDKNPLNFI
jgi:phospholipase/carboxylesterase